MLACASQILLTEAEALSPRIGQFEGRGVADCQPDGRENSKWINLARQVEFERITSWLTGLRFTERNSTAAPRRAERLRARDLPFRMPRGMNVFTTGRRSKHKHADGNEIPSPSHAGRVRLAVRRLAGLLAGGMGQIPAAFSGDGSEDPSPVRTGHRRNSAGESHN